MPPDVRGRIASNRSSDVRANKPEPHRPRRSDRGWALVVAVALALCFVVLRERIPSPDETLPFATHEVVPGDASSRPADRTEEPISHRDEEPKPSEGQAHGCEMRGPNTNEFRNFTTDTAVFIVVPNVTSSVWRDLGIPSVALLEWQQLAVQAQSKAKKGHARLREALVPCTFLMSQSAFRPPLSEPQCDAFSAFLYRSTGSAMITLLDVTAWMATELFAETSKLASSASHASTTLRLANASGAMLGFFEARRLLHRAALEAAAGRQQAVQSLIATAVQHGRRTMRTPRWVPRLWVPSFWLGRTALALSLYVQLHALPSTTNMQRADAPPQPVTVERFFSEWLPKARFAAAPQRRITTISSDASVQRVELMCVRYAVVVDAIAETPKRSQMRSWWSELGLDDVSDFEDVVDDLTDRNVAMTLRALVRQQRWGASARGCASVKLVVLVAVADAPRRQPTLTTSRRTMLLNAFQGYMRARAAETCRPQISGDCQMALNTTNDMIAVEGVSVNGGRVAKAQQSRRRLSNPDGHIADQERQQLLRDVDGAFGPAAHEAVFFPAALCAAAHAFPSIYGKAALTMGDEGSDLLRPTHVAVIPPRIDGRRSVFIPQNAVRYLSLPHVRALNRLALSPTLFLPAPDKTTVTIPTSVMSVRMFSIVARMAVVTTEPNANATLAALDSETVMHAVRSHGKGEHALVRWLGAVGLSNAVYTAYDDVDGRALQVDVASIEIAGQDGLQLIDARQRLGCTEDWLPISIDGVRDGIQ